MSPLRNEINGAPKSVDDIKGSHEGSHVVASLEAKVANLEEKLAEANGDVKENGVVKENGKVEGKAEEALNGHAPP